MENEKISIISIIYNVEPFLRQCIESMVNQTYKNLEIILCVAPGKDRCLDIAREYEKKDDRVKVVIREEGCIGFARNKGLAAVTGDYIGFVDGDDWVESDMFEKLYKNLKENNADISVCGKFSEYEDKSVSDPMQPKRLMTAKESFEMLLRGNGFFFHCWDKLFKKEIFDGLLFPKDKNLEDRYVIGKALAKTDRIIYDTAPLYHYRIRGDSMSRIIKMSELNTDANIDFCEYATGIYPELKNLADATLIYDHITCVQNYLLYFKGTENDSTEMRDRYRAHTDFIKEHAGDKNPEISKKLRLKIFMTLHMQWFLSAFTKKKTERIKRQNEVYTKPIS